MPPKVWRSLAVTRLEPDLDDLLWSTVNLFHRACQRLERELDDNEVGQRRLQKEQDGSEVKSVELERLTAQGQSFLDTRKVPQVAFKPDWTRHAKAAPFKRNDQMLAVMPIGVIIFPGTGIQDNLADKARKLGIPVYRFGSGGA